MKETYVTRSCISFLLLHQGPPLCLLLSSAPSFMVLLFLHLLIPLTPSVLLECSTKPQNHNPEYGKQVSSSLVVLIWFPGDLSMQEGAYTKLCFQHLSSWLHLSVAHNGILGDFQYKEKGFVPKEKKKARKKAPYLSHNPINISMGTKNATIFLLFKLSDTLNTKESKPGS